MNYLSKFDSDGKRISSYPLDNSIDDKKREELIADGYIEIDEDEWSYYVGNKGTGKNGTGYVRGADGKPTDAPAYTPSTDEKKASIIAEYNAAKATLTEQYMDAMIHADTELAEEIQTEMQDLDAALDAAIKELEG
ncbi:hypothetical protein SELR_16620 [Selenomonas ruminantium subsp. lactilytica TAM6421]|uniref:Uncharacterized protein n=1 Tax=Selenomonas ruminantium subsp. lactilytica (strain NBRC 103574 / TAM6421) TaxID=927704 RepID=I0GRI3_SELRL|nr:hypothetical protein [Selenomonas ruminantium]BAL83370.1 hypothetical protein SELR_16620 [Selenomonas ruminantium subsp. lactilytica TAM6421]